LKEPFEHLNLLWAVFSLVCVGFLAQPDVDDRATVENHDVFRDQVALREILADLLHLHFATCVGADKELGVVDRVCVVEFRVFFFAPDRSPGQLR
jgi:hypothetical protein